MQVANIQQTTAGETCEIGGEVTFDAIPAGPFYVWFRLPREHVHQPAAPLGDAFVAALLPIAMACAEPLVIKAAVSETLLRSLDAIQHMYNVWEPSMSKIDVIPDAVIAYSTPSEASGVGLFFSLGVDSFYSLLRNADSPTQEPITHIILVRGFDISLDDTNARVFENSLAAANQVADTFGKTLIPVTTNIRQIAERFVPWGRIYHGAALASVGLATRGALRSVYVASSYDLANLKPWGSHPALDPLWSNGWTSFVHDACEVSRLEKVRLLSGNRTALDLLRVCFENVDSDYNCGRCDKCLLTMVSLQLVGGLQRCRTLPKKIDLGLFDRVKVNRAIASSSLWKENLAVLQHSYGEDELKDAVNRYLTRARSDKALQTTGMYAEWIELKRHVAQELERLSQPHEIAIVAGEENVSRWVAADIHICSFPEKEGMYWGAPADDHTAIERLEHARRLGARLFVIDRECFWWLDYYTGFRDHLHRHYRSVISNTALIVFELSARVE